MDDEPPLEKRCPLENGNRGEQTELVGDLAKPVPFNSHRFLPLDSPCTFPFYVPVSFVPFDLFLQPSLRVVSFRSEQVDTEAIKQTDA